MSNEACVFELGRLRAHIPADGDVVHASDHAETRLLPKGYANGGDDAWLELGERPTLRAHPAPGAKTGADTLAYRIIGAANGAAAAERTEEIDVAAAKGNDFRVLFESARAAGALLTIGPGRAVEVGPESERTWVVLGGSGLVFLQHDTTLPLGPGDVAIVPAGEPARLWSRGPGPFVVVALQPQAPPAKRRTLLSEVMRLRDKERRVSGAGF